MSEEQALSEISGVPRKTPPEAQAGTAPEECLRYHCRWDRDIKEGESCDWHEVAGAQDAHEAAESFAKSCDIGNPRPPIKRIVVVALPRGGTRLIEVVVKPSLSYETTGI